MITPEVEKQLQKLADAGIEILPMAELTKHFALGRDRFVALVERKDMSFGKPGAPGLITDKGFAALVWRGESAFFVARGFEQAATAEDVDEIRRFAEDLKGIFG